jgi:hypothetical protein
MGGMTLAAVQSLAADQPLVYDFVTMRHIVRNDFGFEVSLPRVHVGCDDGLAQGRFSGSRPSGANKSMRASRS